MAPLVALNPLIWSRWLVVVLVVVVGVDVGAIAAADGVVAYVGGECSSAVSQVGGAAFFAIVAVSDTPFRTGEPLVPGRSLSRSCTLRLTVRLRVTAAAFSHDVCPCQTINAVVEVTRYLVPLSRPHGQETPTESEGVVAVAQLALVNGWWSTIIENYSLRKTTSSLKRENVAWKTGVERLEQGSKVELFSSNGPAKSMPVTLKGNEYVQRSGGRDAII
ncbi:hypothetical protein FF38_06103 [Lucilia cuprina]|uniref:Uncharacterized protein n=1 Tax=Lucilia cuprina TaxID=7375 RepID=A0A0L0CHY2_LUCCU|nr:hypothetical protein FF38_06103 [Lucilia cuprina]